MARPISPPSLKRRPVAQPKLPVIWIYCEGQNTETSYLEGFAAHVNGPVQLKIAGGVGVPMTIVRAALAKRKELAASGTLEHDEIWVVFDEDTHPDRTQAINAAKQNGISVAFSSPCFELWAILHDRDHDAPITSKNAQKLTSQIYPHYDHNNGARLKYGILAGGYEQAVRRAKAMQRKRADELAPMANPYTDVNALTEAIAQKGQPEKVEAARKGAAHRHAKQRPKN